MQQTITDKKTCSARHSQHADPRTGTSSSALEVNQITRSAVTAKKWHFCILDLDFLNFTTWCSNKGTVVAGLLMVELHKKMNSAFLHRYLQNC